MNVAMIRRLGESTVGIVSLIFSFYSFVIILAGGNIFTATSRFVSEEIGCSDKNSGCCNAERIMGYSMTFGLGLSCIAAVALALFSPHLAERVLKNADAAHAIRLLAFSLPLATIGACVKGYFHARRMVLKPCIADLLESSIRFAALLPFLLFLLPSGKSNIFTAIALSIIAGEIVSCCYLSVAYASCKNPCAGKNPDLPASTISSLWSYCKAVLPIVISGYTFVLLSGSNEALVPLMLVRFSGSAEEALSNYGVFEGIVMQVIFYPSILLQSLSVILIPEMARIHAANHSERIRFLTAKVLRLGLAGSIFVAMVLFCQGQAIGSLFCDDPLAGETLRILCPVVPFIYLEMLMEGVLKGIGKQNFCTLNSAAEYIIRISCVLVFTPLYGFTGIIISYFASNITCNLVRIFMVLRSTKAPFSIRSFLGIPLLAAVPSALAGQHLSAFLPEAVSGSALGQVLAFLAISGPIYLMLVTILDKNKPFRRKKFLEQSPF